MALTSVGLGISMIYLHCQKEGPAFAQYNIFIPDLGKTYPKDMGCGCPMVGILSSCQMTLDNSKLGFMASPSLTGLYCRQVPSGH